MLKNLSKYSFPLFLSPDTGDLSNADRPTIPPASADLPPPSTTGPPDTRSGPAVLSGADARKRLAPDITPDEQARREQHARAAATTLRDQAERAARAESERTGKPVEPAKTKTAEELLAESFTQEGTLRGPATVEARPGESTNGPQSAAFSRTRVVPEHMVSNIAVVPTVNAPGLGADSGIKLTPDNLDARGGSGHDDGPDPADAIVTAANPNGVTGVPGVHSATRGDTAEKNAERIADAAKALSTGPAAEAKADAIEQTRAQEELARAGGGPDAKAIEPVADGAEAK